MQNLEAKGRLGTSTGDRKMLEFTARDIGSGVAYLVSKMSLRNTAKIEERGNKSGKERERERGSFKTNGYLAEPAGARSERPKEHAPGFRLLSIF